MSLIGLSEIKQKIDIALSDNNSREITEEVLRDLMNELSDWISQGYDILRSISLPINGANTSTLPIMLGSVAYNIAYEGVYTNFLNHEGSPISVTSEDLYGKFVQFHGIDGVFVKITIPVLDLLTLDDKFFFRDRTMFEHPRGATEITGNVVYVNTLKSACVYEVLTKTGPVSKLTIPFIASTNNTVELRIYQGNNYNSNLSTHTLLATKNFALGEFNTSGTDLTTVELPTPITVTAGKYLYVAIISTTGTDIKMRRFDVIGAAPERHRFLFSNNVGAGTAWSTAWSPSSADYYSTSFKLEYMNKEVNKEMVDRITTSLNDAKTYVESLMSTLSVKDALFEHVRGTAEITGNLVFVNTLKSACVYEIMTKTGPVSKLTLPFYGSSSNTVELRIYQGNTYNANLSTHTLLATKNYSLGEFNTSSVDLTTVELPNPIWVTAGKYLYIAIITTTGTDVKIRRFDVIGSAPERHRFLFSNNVSAGTAWTTPWVASSVDYYAATFKLEYLNPDIATKIQQVRDYADLVSLNSLRSEAFSHPRGTEEITGNAQLNTFKSSCVYEVMTKSGLVTKLTLPFYAVSDNTVELRVYQGTTYNANLSLHTLLATKTYGLGEFNRSGSDLTIVELPVPISVVAGRYLYVAVITTTGGNLITRYFNAIGSDPARHPFLFTSNIVSAWSTAWTASSAGFYSGSFKLEFINPSLTAALDEVKPDPKICMPSKIYAIVGRDLILYYENFIFGNERGEQGSSGYTVSVNCSVGRGYRTFYKLNATAGETGTYTMTITVYDISKRIVAKKIVSLVVKAATALAAEKNILLLGDSLTAPSVTVSQMETLFIALGGVQPVFRGTQTGGKTEGRPGWTFANFAGVGKFFHTFQVTGVTNASGYYTNNNSTYLVHEVNVTGGTGFINCVRSAGVTSPDASGVLTRVAGSTGQATINYSSWSSGNSNNLHDGTALNMNYYRTTKLSMPSGIVFDVVSIQLGINDILPDPTELILDSQVTAIINSAKTLINALIADGTGKIIINLPPSCNNTGGGFLRSSGYEFYIQNMRKLWIAIIANFDNSVFHASVEVGFTGAFVHRYYGYPLSTTPVSIYTGVVENVHTNSVHPATDGYKEIGNGLFHHVLSSIS